MEKKYKIDHIGLVVKDVEKTAKMLTNYLGIDDWSISTIEPPMLYNMEFYGKEVCHSFRIAVGQLSSISIELLMPIKGESVYSEFLKLGREGFHHICLTFSNNVELEEVKEELIKKGGRIIQSGIIKDRAFYWYIDKEGIILELLMRELK